MVRIHRSVNPKSTDGIHRSPWMPLSLHRGDARGSVIKTNTTKKNLWEPKKLTADLSFCPLQERQNLKFESS